MFRSNPNSIIRLAILPLGHDISPLEWALLLFDEDQAPLSTMPVPMSIKNMNQSGFQRLAQVVIPRDDQSEGST